MPLQVLCPTEETQKKGTVLWAPGCKWWLPLDANRVSWDVWPALERPFLPLFPLLLPVQHHCGIEKGEAELGSCILGHESENRESLSGGQGEHSTLACLLWA